MDDAQDAADAAAAGTSTDAAPAPGSESPGTDQDLEDLLAFLRDARGFDFTGYKRSSLARRIQKRMREVRIETWTDYRDQLEIDADEFGHLFNTILINVTSFFRDTEAWRVLQGEVVPQIVSAAAPDHEFRIWSAGCSSGQEAYSMAIVFAEALGAERFVERVKIYGTDVDDEALREARSGCYSARALEPISQELRDKYFEPSGSNFVFRSDLRRRVIFGRHDLTRDAPISRLDLLACRNTLMYFNVEAQAQIIDRLHFALNDDGFLFLGKAEMLLSDSDRFEAENIRQRIFRRRPGTTSLPHTPVQMRLESRVADQPTISSHKRLIRDLIVDALPYPVLGLDVDGTIVAASAQARSQFGITGHDLGRRFSDHELSFRPAELRSLIDQAQQERRSIRLTGVEHRVGGAEPSYFDIVVQPLWSTDGVLIGTSITFLDTTVQTRLQQEVKRVREDLETAYEELQSTNEELETTNEELQSSIEELETTNEELQSTNEELETTNEELQSGNEELETMNEEMRIRSNELDDARSFLEGVVSSIGAGVVVVDGALVVQGWNRGAQEMWGLLASEVVNEPFFGLEFGLPTADLRSMVQDCLSTRTTKGPVRLPAVNRKGRSIWCTVTCYPLDGRNDGAVLLMEQSEND